MYRESRGNCNKNRRDILGQIQYYDRAKGF